MELDEIIPDNKADLGVLKNEPFHWNFVATTS